MSNGNGNGNGNLSKKSKLTLSGILAALVGSGGYFVQKAGDEISFLHENAIRHEAQTVKLEEDVKRLESELKRLEDALISKLNITIP
jgi:hypothetical protein